MLDSTLNHFWELAMEGHADRAENYGTVVSPCWVYEFQISNAVQVIFPDVFGDVRANGFYNHPVLSFWKGKDGGIMCEW